MNRESEDTSRETLLAQSKRRLSLFDLTENWDLDSYRQLEFDKRKGASYTNMILLMSFQKCFEVCKFSEKIII